VGFVKELSCKPSRSNSFAPASRPSGAQQGERLITMIEQGLGVAFTDDVRQAWTELYGVISSTMIDAAQREPVAA
jgi:hypothetical protein